ncbi:N-acetylmuramoyl-L-alanine amidase [Ornithinibacillus salinisoli]|uniref:N-acetylmuramoyl-L-alanine amidase n=1 Tax=Ornithinibacillus salinisoli TaxID=1848459 RepID=A0ABW4W334_9BACI
MQSKKIIILAIGIIILVFSMSQVVFADDAVINVDNLNVRGGPGTNFDVVGQIHTDESYPIIQKDNEWIEIQLENGTGWVSSEYITVKGETEETSPPSSLMENEKSITIVYDNTQIRDGSSTDHEIIHFADKGTVFNVISETAEWYEIENDSVSGFVHKDLVNKNQQSNASGFKGKTIVIDAGHGGRDVGAIGANETYEKHLTYKTAYELEQLLTLLGAEVVLTRSEDEYIFLGSRSSVSNHSNTDAFISIHYNSVPELPSATGIGTYYYHDQYESLANYIQEGIVKETDARDRNATFGDYQVIRQNYKPSVLLELGFISNAEEEMLLLTNAYQQKIVSGIVYGLGKYFSNAN